jgi:hypothetical protein
MKRKIAIQSLTLFTLLVSTISASASPLLISSEPNSTSVKCTNSTLKGTYIYRETGVKNGVPYAQVGREVYDGIGRVVTDFQGSDGKSGKLIATYEVSADCVKKAVYSDGKSFTAYISPDGSKWSYVMSNVPGDEPSALSGWEMKVSD